MQPMNQLLYYSQVQTARDVADLAVTPHLAYGTGPTGGFSHSPAQTGGFIAQEEGYSPLGYEYHPANNTSFTEPGEMGEKPLALGPKDGRNFAPQSFNHNALSQQGSGIPDSIGVGDDGLLALNPTYRAHDFTPATRQQHQWRSAPAWQVIEYPPNYRQLAEWQAVHRYIVQSSTIMPRVLDKSDYFYGYQMTPTVAASIGGMNALGSLGSGG